MCVIITVMNNYHSYEQKLHTILSNYYIVMSNYYRVMSNYYTVMSNYYTVMSNCVSTWVNLNLCVSVYMCFVVTCWKRADLFALVCGV